MSYVRELYRQEALGLISSREFDRRFDDAVEQDIYDLSQMLLGVRMARQG